MDKYPLDGKIDKNNILNLNHTMAILPKNIGMRKTLEGRKSTKS